MIIEQVNPRNLKPHERNAPIYGEDEPIGTLVERIRRSGWIKPLVVNQHGVIVSGHRRWRAALELGIGSIPVERRQYENDTAELEALLLENATRDKTHEQKVREAEEWVEIEKAKAKSRQGTRTDLLQNFATSVSPSEKVRAAGEWFAEHELKQKEPARDRLAEKVGFGSGFSYEKAKKVVDQADVLRATGDSERARTWLNVLNNQSVDAAAKLLKEDAPIRVQILDKIATGEARNVPEAKRKVIADQIRAEPEPLPDGPFRVIAIDPPWAYGKRPDDITHRARLQYPEMSTEKICRLPVAERAAPDCILWLWTTNAHMRDAFQVLDAWGFEHRTILTWVKDRMGTGDWLRGQTEHCLMAIKGRPTVLLTNQTTVLHGPLREHSRKPDEFYALVDALCPGSKLEMFGRESRAGWVVWGGEKEKFDVA